MSHAKRILHIIAVCLLALAASGCAQQPAKQEAGPDKTINTGPVEVALRQLLPAEAPKNIIETYVQTFAERMAKGAKLLELRMDLAALLRPLHPGEDPYGIAGRVVDGWQQDGNRVQTVPEFRAQWAGVKDWNLYYTLTQLAPVLKACPDWKALLAYARYRGKAKDPAGLKAFLADPAAYSPAAKK